MKLYSALFYLFLATGFTGCAVNYLEPYPGQRPISSYSPQAASRRLEKCTVFYSFANSARYFSIASQMDALTDPFRKWQEASNGHISFLSAASRDAVDLQFIFSDTTHFENITSELGLIPHEIPELSKSVIQKNGTYTVYLDNSFRWELEILQRVLLFHVGVFLGLPPSKDPNSALFPGSPKMLPALDSSDIRRAKQLYDGPCDEWIRLRELPFSSFYIRRYFQVKSRGYVLLDGGKLWEYDPMTDSWAEGARFPLSSGPYSSNGLAHFTIGDYAYVGSNAQWMPGDGDPLLPPPRPFYRYTPATETQEDHWDAVASLPYQSIGPVWTNSGFAHKGKGYIFTDLLVEGSLDSTYNSGVWVYDVADDRWTMPDRYRLESGSDGYSGRTFAVSVGEQNFILPLSGWVDEYLQFDPDAEDPWSVIPRAILPSTISYLVFSARQTIFVMTYYYNYPEWGGYVTSISRYDAILGWQRQQDFDTRGRASFSFVFDDTAYIGTESGSFWAYNP